MKKILSLILSLMIFLLLSIPIYAEVVTDMVIRSYDNTSIEDDLVDVDLGNFVKNEFGECAVISMMEYCFSFNSSYTGEYGLYLYIYNPTCVPLERDSSVNSVTLVSNYSVLEELTIEIYNPDIDLANREFQKFGLIYLDSTSDYLFYKFKVDLPESFLVNMQKFARARSGFRRYEISEFELKNRGGSIKAFSDHVYVYSGFAAYCGEDGSSIGNLACKNYGTRSIHLNLDHTNYRGGFRGNVCDDLNTVIFTIPESYFQEFGNLNSIDTQWYEYVTSPMFVTSDSDSYRSLWAMRDILINEYGQQIDAQGNILSNTLNYTRVLWEEYMDDYYVGGGYYNMHVFKKAYNPKCRDDVAPFPQYVNLFTNISLSNDCTYASMVSWLFYVENVTGADAYCVTKDDVKDYMRKYSNDFSSNLVLGKYASSLFSVDKGLQRLKIQDQNFQSFIGNSSSQSYWDQIWNGKQYDTITYDPIVIIDECDLILSEKEFSELYLVNINDAASIMKHARESFDNNERTVLLRFAVRDYYACSARFDFVEDSNTQDLSEVDGYVAQETVFLNFDVISLGFKDANGASEIVIGAVADPIDIINGLTPPDDLVTEQAWWQTLVALLLLILLIVVLSFIFPFVSSVLKMLFDGLMFIFKLLFSILGIPIKIINGIGKRRKK